MSHIPSSAMPHAGGPTSSQGGQGSETSSTSTTSNSGAGTSRGRANKLADKARDNPKTAVAAGVVVAGALAAAAAIPIVRARKNAGGSTKSSAKKSGSSKSGSSKNSSSKND